MAQHYKETVGTDIIVNIGEDITGATNTKLKVQKPDGTEVEWIASIYNTNYLKYTVQENDWNQWGTYKVHSYLTINGWTGHGDCVTFTVDKLYK